MELAIKITYLVTLDSAGFSVDSSFIYTYQNLILYVVPK